MADAVRLGNAAIPPGLDDRTSKAGLRAIATLEAAKGIGVILLLLILFGIHRHAEDLVEALLYHVHIDPDRRAAQAILHAADRLTDMRMWTIAAAALSYSTVRFVEAWGLWHRRVWAEWFALLSGALYLPWEVLKVAERASWMHIFILSINVIIVLYMLYIRIRSMQDAPVVAMSSGQRV
ncbi:MAG: rane protein-like protein [Bryobacterales bacterium]|jgi:uncharacterized membrane protein (DUF2068 family)|nr:rane protein-like protein [Bryobacterales bacterium]